MADIAKLLEEIDSLTVIELSELVKGIEEKYGVTAAAVAAPAAGAGAAGAGEEKSSFNIVLKDAGSNKIAVIKKTLTDNRLLIFFINSISHPSNRFYVVSSTKFFP